MKKTTIYIALATLCLNFNANGQDKTNIIKQLKIGDTIPKAVWNMPLQVLNHQKGTGTKTLNDYKGKLILFDFWSTWCGPCVRSLQKLDSIQRYFPDKIQVLLITRDKQERLQEFLNKSQFAVDVRLPFFSETPNHLVLFPHTSIPHIIIIDKKGEIKAITGSKGITLKNIESLINNKPIEFPLKNDFDQ